ncbi:MAG TPA: hypothetical protein PKE04_16760, partial [Clostridia bacterium]|nr:hypothetical protein [Clostridia bacterium]
ARQGNDIRKAAKDLRRMSEMSAFGEKKHPTFVFLSGDTRATYADSPEERALSGELERPQPLEMKSNPATCA